VEETLQARLNRFALALAHEVSLLNLDSWIKEKPRGLTNADKGDNIPLKG